MKVVHTSFSGRYSDSPRAVYEALVARGRADVEHTWLADPAHAHSFPEGVRTVRIGGPECVAALEAADVLVSNDHVPIDGTKRPGRCPSPSPRCATAAAS